MDGMSLPVVSVDFSRQDLKLALIALELLSSQLQTAAGRQRVIKGVEKTKASCSFNYDITLLDGNPELNDSRSAGTIYQLCDKFFDAFACSIWAERHVLGLPDPLLPDHVVDLELALLPPEVYHE